MHCSMGAAWHLRSRPSVAKPQSRGPPQRCLNMKPIHFTTLPSPLGELTLAATDRGLCGLYFEDHKYWPTTRPTWHRDDGHRFDAARSWLANYFAGKKPGAMPAMDFVTGTEFQRGVWKALQRIPAGQTRSYAKIAETIGRPKAVRAVGAAIGHNPMSIFVPCHRVIGSNGSLTGFAGGMDRKQWLLAHEGAKGAWQHEAL